MRYFKIYALSALAIFMASCSSDNDTIEPVADNNPAAKSGSMSFSASIDAGDATRTALSSNASNPYPVWSSGDQIKVVNATTQDTQLFTIGAADDGKRAATFTGNIKVDRANPNTYYALYAGNVAATGGPTITQSGSVVSISGSIPSNQTPVLQLESTDTYFNPSLHFMTACTTNDSFHFKNGMSLLKIYIADNNYVNFGICKIVFTANNGEKITGDFTAEIANDGTLTNYNVTNNANAKSEITIGDGTTPLASGYYYIAIHPCTFSKGFTLTYLDERDNNKKQYDRIRTTSLSVAASKIVDLGTYTARDCAKEAYVDLGLVNTTTDKKVMFCIENVYDDFGSSTCDSTAYYSWGELNVKANQTKETDCQNYSWYYTYGIGQGGSSANITQNEEKRSYKYGIGKGHVYDAAYAADRYIFTTSTSGVLSKYNSNPSYENSITDWSGGATDKKTELETMDDAAYQKSPQHIVRIPLVTDFEALNTALSNGNLSAGYNSAYPGCLKIICKKEGSTYYNRYIVLPRGGYKHKTSSSDSELKEVGQNCYWTRIRGNNSFQARSYVIIHNADGTLDRKTEEADRCQGRKLRGVIYK